MEIKEKYPIIITILVSIFAMVYSLWAKYPIFHIVKNTIIIIIISYISTNLLKIYLNKKVFNKDEEFEEEERPNIEINKDIIEEDN